MGMNETEVLTILINPHCGNHPLIGKTFLIKHYPGTYKVVAVDVVHEIRKIIKIVAKLDSHEKLDKYSTAGTITSVWASEEITELANNNQLRLEVDAIPDHQKIKSIDGNKVEVKTKEPFPALQLGMLE